MCLFKFLDLGLSSCLCIFSFSVMTDLFFFFFFSSRRRHTRFDCDWSSDVCSSDLEDVRRFGEPCPAAAEPRGGGARELLLELREIAERLLDGVRQRPGGLAAALEIGRASCRERV